MLRTAALPYSLPVEDLCHVLEHTREAWEERLPDPPLEVRVARPRDPSLPAIRYVPSIERARRELGVKVNIPLPEALRRTLAWHQAAGEHSIRPPLRKAS